MIYKPARSAIVIFLIAFCLHYTALAEEAASGQAKKESGLNAEQEAIKRDRELLQKLMLQNQPARRPDPEVKGVEFGIGDNTILGSESAKLIIVQFSDYSCHHCAFFTRGVFPEIVKNYVDTGKLRYVVIDFPLLANVPAFRAAEAAHCASDQGKFWQMHEEIMNDQKSLGAVNSLAFNAGLDMNKFKECMESGKYSDLVMKNMALADKLGIPSVPGFIIGTVDPDNPRKVKGISYIRGAKPYKEFRQEIDKALAGLKKQ